MSRILTSMIICLYIFISCSTSTKANDEQDVSLFIESASLIIHNGTANIIYYFAVESNMAEVIDWAPSLRHPSIGSKKSISLSLLEIPNGSDKPIKSGDTIIVYWWDKNVYENSDMHIEEITF